MYMRRLNASCFLEDLREFRSPCLSPMIWEQILKILFRPVCLWLRGCESADERKSTSLKMAEDVRTDRQWTQFAENVKCPLPWLSNRFCVHIRFKVIKNDTQVFVQRDHFYTVVVNDALLCYVSVSPEINHWLFGFDTFKLKTWLLNQEIKSVGAFLTLSLEEEPATQRCQEVTGRSLEESQWTLCSASVFSFSINWEWKASHPPLPLLPYWQTANAQDFPSWLTKQDF